MIMTPYPDVQLVPILLATVAQMALGFVWYSPKTFGTAWMKHVGLTQEDAEKEGGTAMVKGVLSTLISTYFLAVLVTALGLDSLTEVVCAGITISLATLVPLELNNVIWARGPMGLFWINAGHAVVSLMVASLVLVQW